MKRYKVTYKGNATKFKGFEKVIAASSKRDAVEKVYARFCGDDYWPDEYGNIYDSDRNLVGSPSYNTIDFDGGEFMAEEFIYRLMNHDSISKDDDPKFESYILSEYNEQYGTNYSSVEEATNDDPEYLFDLEQMMDFIS